MTEPIPASGSTATADVSDALGAQGRAIAMQWRNLGGRPAFHGPARTLRCRDTVGLVRQVLGEPGEGCVLVVDGDGSKLALLGDRLASLAAANGWSGVIVHGPVRDTAVLATLAIGVFALGATPQRGSFDLAGERDLPVSLGGVVVRPGDHLFCDGDGVVVCEADAARGLLTTKA